MTKWLRMWYIRNYVKSGPVMISARDRWIFVDYIGSIYEIRPTFDYNGTPLIITLIKK